MKTTFEDTTTGLRDGFAQSRIIGTNIDMYLDNGAIHEGHAKDKPFVGHVWDRPTASFWVAIDCHKGYFNLVCLGEEAIENLKPMWLVKVMSMPCYFPSSEHFKHIEIQYNTSTSTSRDVKNNYMDGLQSQNLSGKLTISMNL